MLGLVRGPLPGVEGIVWKLAPCPGTQRLVVGSETLEDVTLHHALGGLGLSLGLLPHAQQVEGGVWGNVLVILARHGVTH